MACIKIQLYVIFYNNIYQLPDVTFAILLEKDRYTYCEPKDGLYGAFVNNSWNGMVRMLIDGVSSL